MSPALPRLSACIIARDEAAVLTRCIESIRDLCDEICVLDTGSRDDTPALARALGAVVDCDTSCNGADGRIADFSRARNRSLGLASGAWILQIDADEVLLAGHEALERAVARDEADVLGITLRFGEAAWMGTRVFRARAARGYLGRVHERLDYQGRFLAAREVVIENRPDKTGKETASARNLRLLRLDVSERPQDSRTWFYLGNEERRAGDFEAAALAYETSIAHGNHSFSRFHAPYYIAICRFHQHRYADAIQVLDRAIAVDPRYGEAHCLRGDAWLMLGDHAKAAADYERALTCGGPPEDAVFAVTLACYGDYPAKRLAGLRSQGAQAS